MRVVGKKSAEDIEDLREQLIRKDKVDHDWFERFKAVMLVFVALVIGASLGTMLTDMIGIGAEMDFCSRIVWIVLLSSIVFVVLYLWLRTPYGFDENSDSLPKAYRYFMLTNGQNVVKEEVTMGNVKIGPYADFEVAVLEEDGDEWWRLVGCFPVELKRDIPETIVDLNEERVYLPCNANDVDFYEDYEDDDENEGEEEK